MTDIDHTRLLISYARVSTEDQPDSSLEEQHRANTIFAAKQKLQVLAKFEDKASGTLAWSGREGMTKVIDLLNRKQAHVVAFYDLSRLGRKDGVTDEVVDSIYAAGGIIGISSTNRLYETLEECYMDTFWAGRAASYEWMKIRQRTDIGKIHHLEAGSWMWKTSTGYRNKKEDGVWKLIIDEPEASFVRDVLSAIANGSTRGSALREANQKYGLDHSLTAVRGFLRQKEFYAGKPVMKPYTVKGERKLYSVSAPAIITEEILRKLYARKFEPLPKAKNPRPFKGVMACTCGENALVISKNQAGEDSYACSSFNRESKARMLGRKYTPTKCRKTITSGRLYRWLRRYLLEPDGLLGVQEERVRELDMLVRERDGMENHIAGLEEKIASYEKQLDEAAEAGTFAAAAQYLDGRLSEAREELKESRSELELIRSDIEEDPFNVMDIDRDKLREALDSQDYKELNRLMRRYRLLLMADFETGKEITMEIE